MKHKIGKIIEKHKQAELNWGKTQTGGIKYWGKTQTGGIKLGQNTNRRN